MAAAAEGGGGAAGGAQRVQEGPRGELALGDEHAAAGVAAVEVVQVLRNQAAVKVPLSMDNITQVVTDILQLQYSVQGSS